ncbi:uncharacterized protein TRIVIDRAFT_89541 [Trichoderma virens Gv29-8]|uniref:Uncharacterized protein n=1 Tax=Hypocrea virens (strain Gv29-8 / FGSC 10586) TaxID=413071 RepID=G9N0Y3_HYPVG|nr:uncharacterized protein TRIVIDRAFT_89541 [Trichoderma virens Gv29-8]EHK19416.1 hypothetical protein TRIVIDRAFT_89541 [Trichoderma virens Gv29-8]
MWDAQRWFQTSQQIAGVSEASLGLILGPLINEAIDDAAKAVEERNKALAYLKVPGFGLPLGHMPPEEERFPVLIGVHSYDWKAATLLIREVCMLKFIEEVTNKPQWWEKVFNPDIANKWKQEALQMDWEEYRKYADFTPAMADACIDELRHKADLVKKTGLITIFDYSSCVIKSDSLIPECLRNALRAATMVLENVPDEEKDWHPGSTHKVLDLVHPSLWPFVYGRTPVLLDKRINLENALSHCGVGTVFPAPKPIEIAGPGSDWSSPLENPVPSLSYKYQWLPCDVVLDGTSAKIDSYINNLHPVEHANLYPIIERFIEKSLPAWDIIYRWPTEFDSQRLKTKEAQSECSTSEICDRIYGCQPWNRPIDEGEPQRDEMEPYTEEYRNSERFKRDMAWLVETHKLNLPEPVSTSDDYFRLKASDVKSSGFFKGASRIQVIVKLANVHLTPEDPEFKFEASKELGGSWHTEGMLNERICATALFYYDSENITDCHLDFRTPADREELVVNLNYEQSQHVPIERTFAIPNTDRDTLQYVGGVLTTNSPSTGEADTRAVFFPNLLQHRVSPFRLKDPTRPGHRKILALFLVDPAIPILSTANVPPQQRHWWAQETGIEKALATRLPNELTQLILGDTTGFPFGLDEAKSIRLDLMDERSMKQDSTEEQLYRAGWNFCEH